jgi:pimeloyl-ACP methyl ester carboxylesterase
VPAELDSLANAKRVTCPAVFVSADEDTIVPASYQQRISDVYAGPKQIVHLPNAGHNTPASEANPKAWYGALDWMWGQVLR